MSDFLNKMARTSRARAEAVTRTFKSSDLDRPVHPLRLTGFDLIAEIKERSPAQGELSANAGNRTDRAKLYVEGGAAAISVLTEPEHFDGTLAHLGEVVDAVGAFSAWMRAFSPGSSGSALAIKSFITDQCEFEP